MSDLFDLERRLRVLEDIEAIRSLKSKYWRSVDHKRWEDLAECFSENSAFETPQFGRMEGRDFIVKVLKRATKNVITVHQGHNPEIELTGDTTARGRWTLNDRVEMADKQIFRGYGQYDEEYVKENGGWKIRQSILSYTFTDGST